MDNEANLQTGFEPLFPAQRRQPHLGYAVALVGIGVLVLVSLSLGYSILSSGLHVNLHALDSGSPHVAKVSIVLEGLVFGITLGVAYLVFPRFWVRPFSQVIEWNAATARRHAAALAATGVGLSLSVQVLESRLTLPSQMPVDRFFQHPSDVWVIAVFGTLLAPVFEEIFFRGFLLRGFAILFDWLLTPRTDAGMRWWIGTGDLSQRSMIASGLLTSGLFAAMHAAQLGFAWNAVGLLWIVGGALTYARIRLNSVAASSVIHAVYNGWIFVVIFFATGGFRHLDKLTNH